MSNNTTVSVLTLPPQRANILKPVVYFITFVTGTAGNVLVLTVEKEKRRRTVDDLFITNLAISDMLFLFLYLPGVIYRLTQNAPYSLLYCFFLRPSVTAVFCSSVFTITSMAIYRSKVIRNPFSPRMKIRYAYAWIAVIWILAYAVSLPAMLVAKVKKTGWCTGVWPGVKHKEAYIIGLLVVKCLLPLFIITVAYIRIGLYVRETRLPQSIACSSTVVRENQIIKTLSVMVLLLAICTAPNQIAWMIKIIFRDEETAQVVFDFSPSLNHFHSCVNPVIYGALTRHFLRGYIKYISYVFCCFSRLACYRTAMNEASSVASEQNFNRRFSVEDWVSRRPSAVHEIPTRSRNRLELTISQCHTDTERIKMGKLYNTLYPRIVNHAQKMDLNTYGIFTNTEISRSLSNVTYIDTDDSSTGNSASCTSVNNHFDSRIDRSSICEEEIILTVLNNFWQVERDGRHGSTNESFHELNFDFSDIVRDTTLESLSTNEIAEEAKHQNPIARRDRHNQGKEMVHCGGFNIEETKM